MQVEGQWGKHGPALHAAVRRADELASRCTGLEEALCNCQEEGERAREEGELRVREEGERYLMASKERWDADIAALKEAAAQAEVGFSAQIDALRAEADASRILAETTAGAEKDIAAAQLRQSEAAAEALRAEVSELRALLRGAEEALRLANGRSEAELKEAVAVHEADRKRAQRRVGELSKQVQALQVRGRKVALAISFVLQNCKSMSDPLMHV